MSASSAGETGRPGRSSGSRRNTAFQYSYATNGPQPAIYYDQVGCDRDDLASIYRIVDR